MHARHRWGAVLVSMTSYWTAESFAFRLTCDYFVKSSFTYIYMHSMYIGPFLYRLYHWFIVPLRGAAGLRLIHSYTGEIAAVSMSYASCPPLRLLHLLGIIVSHNKCLAAWMNMECVRTEDYTSPSVFDIRELNRKLIIFRFNHLRNAWNTQFA